MSVIAFRQRNSTRFRLRFMTQELDLPLGEFIIGRSDGCDITLFDPLVSRQHASLNVKAEQVVLEDLGSRNGTRVNGKLIKGPVPLKDGDRIALGKNEFVFKEVPGLEAHSRTTGSLVYCAGCQLIYSREAGACPHCASTETMAEPTKSDIHDDRVLGEWALRILFDVLMKALDAGAGDRAERLMEEAISRTQARFAAGKPVEASHIQQLADGARRLSRLQNDERWASWADSVLECTEYDEERPTKVSRRRHSSRPPGIM
jgi:hypothetical protein